MLWKPFFINAAPAPEVIRCAFDRYPLALIHAAPALQVIPVIIIPQPFTVHHFAVLPQIIPVLVIQQPAFPFWGSVAVHVIPVTALGRPGVHAHAAPAFKVIINAVNRLPAGTHHTVCVYMVRSFIMHKPLIRSETSVLIQIVPCSADFFPALESGSAPALEGSRAFRQSSAVRCSSHRFHLHGMFSCRERTIHSF